ncbi:MAG TPA: energy transducer TonB [Pyrinomonadaceae bacterium]|jgi:TonB family protein|nr:energy transducer TonB [Pyrinomonadaceae bacterium]
MKKNIFAPFAAVILTLIFAGLTSAQTDNTTDNKQTPDTKLKILKKTPPESGRCSQSSGMTLVRVTFDKSAKVTDAVVTKSSGCTAFDNNSLKVARKIKFEPEIKDGEPVTVVKPVEYRFRRF